MTPEEAHNLYLKTAEAIGYPVSTQNYKPYNELSESSKALDIAFADACNKEVLEEREACAKIAEAYVFEIRKKTFSVGGPIAQAIRGRGGK